MLFRSVTVLAAIAMFALPAYRFTAHAAFTDESDPILAALPADNI